MINSGYRDQSRTQKSIQDTGLNPEYRYQSRTKGSIKDTEINSGYRNPGFRATSRVQISI